MKPILSFLSTLLLFLAISSSLQAQDLSEYELRLWPFIHGVASGDPLDDRVIIWTRITPGAIDTPRTVSWAMATDTTMTSVVASGTVVADSSSDFTVKLDVTGLDPGTWYYYQFEHEGRVSLVGRTRTAPTGDVDSVRFAHVSCADYVDGYFHGYARIVDRNDVDAVIHCGDYIYENGSGGSLGRPHDPPNRITTLSDYRIRYSQYRLDDDLRCLHQMYPFINVWDDHELANNAWWGGAEAHDEGPDGAWVDRRKIANQVFNEWIPIRHPDPADTFRIYRNFKWGNLFDLVMLDTRLIGRDEQDGGAAADTSRYLLGRDQLSWLGEVLDTVSSQWTVIGQQVMMAPLEPTALFLGVTNDMWDGYQAERNRLYDTLQAKGIVNPVILTGDIHTAWANNLEQDTLNIGVEFVAQSISTMNSPLPLPLPIIQSTNPHIQYANLADHGYNIIDINKDRVQCDFWFAGEITDPDDDSEFVEAHWYTNDGERFLREDTASSIPASWFPIPMPSKNVPNSVGTEDILPADGLAIITVSPNPFEDRLVIQAWSGVPRQMNIQLYDIQGKWIADLTEQQMIKGVQEFELGMQGYGKGLYILKFTSGDTEIIRRIMKK